jgi:DNA-binding MarR family transcriptional regulator
MTKDFPSQVADLPDLRAGATPASRGRDTGPSYYKSNSSRSASLDDDIVAIEVETAALRQAQARRARRFLKGPIPMPDIATAARLPGQALAVFLAVYHRTALTREPGVRLPRALMQELGVTKDAKARALRLLEAAGLIHVERSPGRQPNITLIHHHSAKGV